MSADIPIYISKNDLNGILSLLEEPNMATDNIGALEEELARASVFDNHEMPQTVIAMNSTAIFRFVGEEKVYIKRLVYPVDIEGPDDISILAPVGSALIGLSKGQQLDWVMPNKKVKTIEIIDVMQQ
ncbi:nucleoside diphosphate kinase regulator [Shewanella sp. GXUN23E]|uniref:nucleoside diphosphate kinase regulator n=1 Tax=Shewanella sp. GXUN23E TaxID=3422498 RepID=UPI003D7D4639